MSQLPNVLRVLPDGTLICVDGRDVKAYLAEWAKKVGADQQTPINIMRSEDQQRERDDAWLLRNWSA
jgi:hypothetical protein